MRCKTVNRRINTVLVWVRPVLLCGGMMIETLKQVFFGLLWFTLDSALIFFWAVVLVSLFTRGKRK